MGMCAPIEDPRAGVLRDIATRAPAAPSGCEVLGAYLIGHAAFQNGFYLHVAVISNRFISHDVPQGVFFAVVARYVRMFGIGHIWY